MLIAVEADVGGFGGAFGEAGVVAEVAVEEDVDGFFEGASAFAQVAGEAGVELSSPVGVDEDEDIEQAAEFGMGGEFAVGEKDAVGRKGDFAGDAAVFRVEDGLENGPAPAGGG